MRTIKLNFSLVFWLKQDSATRFVAFKSGGDAKLVLILVFGFTYINKLAFFYYVRDRWFGKTREMNTELNR